jgi:hypothetical protein
MASRKLRKPKTLVEKIEAEYPDFQSEVVGLPIPQLEKRIADMQKELQDAADFQEEKRGEEIQNLVNELKEARGPFTDVKKAVSLKTKYLVTLIREKGGA